MRSSSSPPSILAFVARLLSSSVMRHPQRTAAALALVVLAKLAAVAVPLSRAARGRPFHYTTRLLNRTRRSRPGGLDEEREAEPTDCECAQNRAVVSYAPNSDQQEKVVRNK